MNPGGKERQKGQRMQSEEDKWEAVVRRDDRGDGEFVYAVKTTGVYCRPSCAARRPKRENVRFFAEVTEAERAGFRACKRCRPKEAPLAEQRRRTVEQACRALDDQQQPVGLKTLAATAGMSSSHFHRVFKALTGLTP